jgi:glycosyltransferase involved in cell wall biosynthesis
MERISGAIPTYNEADNIAACIASIKGVDEIVVSDDGSTDDTVKIAREMGAKVYRRKLPIARATQSDIDRFQERFGWLPTFKKNDPFSSGVDKGNDLLDHCENDWIIGPDADERISWNLPYIREIIMPQADQIVCDFVHSHKADGSPNRVSTITKCFRKSKAQFAGRTHTCLLPAGVINKTRRMRIDHWQKEGHSQPHVLPYMEYSIIADGDDNRTRMYLGREYYHYHRYTEAITLLELYLSRADWIPEIAHARLYLARAFWESGKGDQAREQCREAVTLNPDFGEALYLMSELYYEPWSSKWRAIAERATNDGILW